MLKICSVFWTSEPQYAYTRYAYKRKTNSHDEFSLYKEFSDYSTIIHSLAPIVGKFYLFIIATYNGNRFTTIFSQYLQ